jgi:hypothetical protein
VNDTQPTQATTMVEEVVDAPKPDQQATLTEEKVAEDPNQPGLPLRL